MVQTVGYGETSTVRRRVKIKPPARPPEADVHFLVGGTQTNTTVIAAILRPPAGVTSAVSGHINCHEAGAIESTGHKVITLPTTNGKITAQQVQDYVEWHRNDESTEHIVQPGMVYISHPTGGRHAVYQGGADGAVMTPAAGTACRCSLTAHGWAMA